MNKEYDVVILGGGLAGLTLSLQLKRRKPEISVLLLEKREGAAPAAAHKVGESTVELGTYYIREVLDLKNYLDEYQLPKHGLRFYFSPQHKDDLTKRVELGPKVRLPVPSHQLDRGTFENELERRTISLGTKVELGARVKDAEINKDGHTVTYIKDGHSVDVQAKWVVDATSRFSILKRKFGFEKELPHDVNAVWFRVKGEIDVDDWTGNEKWRSFLKPGLRRLGTIHFMDTGYWVWFIPLSSGNTSIGIVADPRFHAFDEINKLDKAFDWLAKNEPQCFKVLNQKRNDVLDFRVLKHYAHHSGQFYSENRWGVTGESGAFLDPFYSPGTDFIAMANTWLTELICKDIDGEFIGIHANIYNQTHSALIDSWLPIYQNQYELFGKTQVMVIKIFWDWAVYWAIPCMLFANEGYTNIILLRDLFSSKDKVLGRFGELSDRMQQVLQDWGPHDTEVFADRYADPFDIGFMKRFQETIEDRYERGELLEKVAENVKILERMAAELFRRINAMVNNGDPKATVDPYLIDLKNPNEAITSEGIPVDAEMASEIDKIWYYQTEMA